MGGVEEVHLDREAAVVYVRSMVRQLGKWKGSPPARETILPTWLWYVWLKYCNKHHIQLLWGAGGGGIP